FSSRRRHTRFSRDWSSDVCSSDLATYRRARSTLLAELGVEPGPELAAAREVSAEPDPYELAAASGVDVASVKRVLACLQRRVHEIGRASCRERCSDSVD